MSDENLERAKRELDSRIGKVPAKKGIWGWGIVAVAMLSTLADDIAIMAGSFDIVMDVLVGGITGFVCIKHILENIQNKRFENYLLRLGAPDIVLIDDLVNSMGYSRRRVLKDIRAMISKGILLQAHLDPDEKYLFMTHEIFHDYMTDMSEKAVNKKKKQWVDPSVAEPEKEEDDELKKTLTEGREYIKKIKKANEVLPGKEISLKLSNLEDNCEQIFSIVEKHPEKLPEIRKFMDYYMPTTVKLVKNYTDFSTGKSKGKNIEKVKNEIEESLDMINLAFGNLSDRLYETNTMDVSTDISVLKTMLAQEGLNETDFNVNK